MSLTSARRQVFSQFIAAGLSESEATAALAALIVAGPLAENVPPWIPSAFASGAAYPARDVVEEMLRLRSLKTAPEKLPGGYAPPDPATPRRATGSPSSPR